MVVGGGGVGVTPPAPAPFYSGFWTDFQRRCERFFHICFMTNTLLRPNAGDNVRKFCTSRDQYGFGSIIDSKEKAIVGFWIPEQADFVSFGPRGTKSECT
jgi:hypothetical protein